MRQDPGRQAAAGSTQRRKRSAFYNALGYAVELGRLPSDPIGRIQALDRSGLASAPKPGKPGPGRPPGSKNRRPATRHDVGKIVKRTEPKKKDRKQKG